MPYILILQINEKALLDRTKTIFSFGCFTLATYYGTTQVFRYIENNDTSVISRKTFNDATDNIYPTFSICLKGKDLYWKNDHDLFMEIGMTSPQYVEFLQGKPAWKYVYNETRRLYEKETIQEDSVLGVEIPGMFLHPSDVIVGTHFVSENYRWNNHFGVGEHDANLQRVPFHIGYQTSDETCFTRDSSDGLKQIRLYDEVLFNQSLTNTGNHRRLDVKIILPHPGQLIERINSPSDRFNLEEWISRTELADGFEENVHWKVSQVSVLKNRPDSFPRCYDGDETDDTRFQLEAVRKVGCIPIYWKNLDSEVTKIGLCKSSKDYQIFQNIVSSYRENLPLDGRSCTSMEILATKATPSRPNANHMTIKISYMEQTYQETKNVKDFTFESFFSSLGGFIGIFLGYSMLQIPELLSDLPLVWKKFKVSMFKVIRIV